MAVSYKDPTYDALDAQVSKELGLPSGLLSGIRLRGERSNADQVSSAGARSVYQITPTTRDLFLKKYGVDAYKSPADAAKVAGLHLKESLQRNKGDSAAAVREYIGGTNPANYGPVTSAYVQRVQGGKSQSARVVPVGRNLLEGFDVASLEKQVAAQKKRDAQPKQVGRNLFDEVASAVSAGVESLIGGAEALATIGTGATTGAVGYITGAVEGLGKSIAEGKFGTQEGVNIAEETAAKRAGQYTYAPRTEAGREQVEAAGRIGEALTPLAPVSGELAALREVAQPYVQARAGQLAQQAAPVARQAAQQVQQAAAGVAQQARQVAQRVLPQQQARAGSVGAAATEQAMQRQTQAGQLPVPVQLTRGQATREFGQTQFERETAKLPEVGAPLRERYATQNEQVMRNFDAWIDESGAMAPDLRSVGKSVDQAIVNKSKTAKAKIRAAYKDAEKAGELEQPIETPALVAHLNDAIPEVATAPVLDTAIKKAVQLGIAEQGPDGTLIPRAAPLKNVEAFRQAMNRASDPLDAPNMRQITIMKGLIDDATENAGGDVYKYARRLRKDYANEFENRAVISQLLRTKPGTTDRAVAFEDIFKKTIIDGSLDDVRMLRKTLQTAGDEGRQAWKELQGQTMAQLRDAAFGNSARDERGNPILSAAALDRRVKSLDADGKLDFIFGKKGAEQIRTLNDLAKVIFTAPPGSVNTSNTASALRVALDAFATGTLTGIPAPAVTALRAVAGKIKDRKLAKRVEDALQGTSTAKF